VLTLSAGCVTIDDNLDDCYSLAELKMEYTRNLAEVDRFAAQVNTVDLFVFSASDSTFVATKRFTPADWGATNTIGLAWLPKEDFIIVACGNMTEGDFACTGYEGGLTNLDVRFVCDDTTGTVSSEHDHFFYGMAKVKSTDMTAKTVELIKDTNDVNIVIKDLSNIVANGGSSAAPDTKVTADNGTINFDNTIALDDTRLMQYISLYPLGAPGEPDVYRSTTRVGRLFDNDGSQVVIRSSDDGIGQILKTDDLTEVVIEAMQNDPNFSKYHNDPNEYLDRCDNFTLTYEMKIERGVVVTALISVNDWNVVTTIPGGL
jgi:hypothetical protein